MKNALVQTWDLDTFFSGGSNSSEFKQFMEGIKKDLAAFREMVGKLNYPQSKEESKTLIPIVDLLQSCLLKLQEAGSFISCLMAQDQNDKRASLLMGHLRSLQAEFDSGLTLFDKLLSGIDNSIWKDMLTLPAFKVVDFPLNERREQANEKMSAELETLASDFSVDGYHGWGELYDTTVGNMTVPYIENGEEQQLSVGQADNKMDNKDRNVRQQVFKSWEQSWSKNADFCAAALNHLSGFRLQLYKHREWDSVLKEPLMINRMSEKTLQVMWEVIDKNKDIFVEYLQRKAKLLGLDALSWYDVEAPIGESTKTFSYDEGAKIITEQFGKFSPKMASFAEKALENRWIEAEDRPGKRPGGFCTSFPISEQTRIFMTYAGSASNISTLAHELGHAYHQHVMNDLPALDQDYAMNVAETASTLAELIVSDAAVKHAENDADKLVLIEDKIQRAVAFFMNIHARFIFETNFYKERKNGALSTEQLNELMESAQKQTFKNALNEYHPSFWASKLHFYITEVPFYNFPYTFGFLFSSGIYAIALNEGVAFEDKYIALLRDTGRMNVEDLAMKHLQVDLTKPEFWQNAVDMCIKDVEYFLEVTSN